MTSVHQCATASNRSLKRALLTPDGAGRNVKAAALDELLNREFARAIKRQPQHNEKDQTAGGESA